MMSWNSASSDWAARTWARTWVQAYDQPIGSAAAMIAAIGMLALIGAWIFEYGFGLSPCPLCLEQRYAYYVSIPLAAMVMLGVSVGSSPKVFTLAFLAIGAVMLWNSGLGVYHAGIEWHWWQGPQDCAAPALTSGFGPAGGLLERIESARVVRCDEAAWRFLGLSLAGYNALISLGLAAIAGFGMVGAWREHKRLQAAEAAEDNAI